MDIFEINRKLARGVNVIGYDPLWKDRSKARFQNRHFHLIKEAGFGHVRINLHPFSHMEPGADHELSPAYLETLDWAVGTALDSGLMVIADLHEFGQMGKDPYGCLPKLRAFWRQAAARWQGKSQDLVFEILNEPHSALTPELWNQILLEPLHIIRETHPDRAVILGPGEWNAMRCLPQLSVPEADRSLIVTVHYYHPMAFTHQGASWTPEHSAVGIEWLGTPGDRDALTLDFLGVQKWAEAHNRPIYLGEFGAYDKGDMASRARYTSFVAREAERHGWSWGYWQFDSDFILWDMARDEWVEPIRIALVPAS